MNCTQCSKRLSFEYFPNFIQFYLCNLLFLHAAYLALNQFEIWCILIDFNSVILIWFRSIVSNSCFFKEKMSLEFKTLNKRKIHSKFTQVNMFYFVMEPFRNTIFHRENDGDNSSGD